MQESTWVLSVSFVFINFFHLLSYCFCRFRALELSTTIMPHAVCKYQAFFRVKTEGLFVYVGNFYKNLDFLFFKWYNIPYERLRNR